MAKKSKYNDSIVYIKKLRTNYRLTYDYLKVLSEYIKTFPKEHRGIHKEQVMVNGELKQQWSRDVSPFKMVDVMSFLVDNSIPFKFDKDVTEADLNVLRKEYAARQQRLNEALKQKLEGIDISDMNFDFMKIKPYDYQKQAIKFFEINDGVALLGDAPGVGKTCSSFAYAAKHQYKTLIICPASLALNWKNEIMKFTHENAHVYKYQPTKKSGKTNPPKEDSLFHIINYESLDSYFKFEYSHKCKNPNCDYEEVSLTKKFKECPSCFSPKSIKSRKKQLLAFEARDGSSIDLDDYDLVILDEAHYIKNDQAERTKLCTKALGEIPRRILATGTAIKSKPVEFFTLLNFLHPEEWKNKHHFGVKYCAGFESPFGWNYDGASNIEELYERMSPFTLRRLKKDVLSHLPPKTRLNIPIQLTAAERREYNKIKKDTVKTLESGETEEKSHLTVLQDLKRFIADIKLDRALAQVEDIVAGGEKVVLMSEFRGTAEAVKKHFGDACVMVHGAVKKEERDESVHRFMTDPKVKVFSGTIMAAGVGLTLTSSSTLGFLGSAWTPADMTQAEDRVHRASTTSDKVHIIKWICEDTIDEDIEALLEEKGKIVNKALDNKSSIESAETLSGDIRKQIIARLLDD